MRLSLSSADQHWELPVKRIVLIEVGNQHTGIDQEDVIYHTYCTDVDVLKKDACAESTNKLVKFKEN